MLTSEQYQKKGGTECPVCGSTDIEGDSIEVDTGCAHQEVRCLECSACWFDTYRLEGYAELDISDVEDPLYAVQYRDMHTAIHNLVMCEDEDVAHDLLREFHAEEQWPLWASDDGRAHGIADTVEIDYRCPPRSHGGRRLVIVNNDNGLPAGIPDVY